MSLCIKAKCSLARSLGARRIIWLFGLQKCHSRLVSNKSAGVNGLFKSLPHAAEPWTQLWLQTSCHCSPTLIGLTDGSSHTRVLTSVLVSRWSACVSRNLPVEARSLYLIFSFLFLPHVLKGLKMLLLLASRNLPSVLNKLYIGLVHFVWMFNCPEYVSERKAETQLGLAVI